MLKKISLILLTVLVGLMIVSCNDTPPDENGNENPNPDEELPKVTLNYTYNIHGNLVDIAVEQVELIDEHLLILGNVAENNFSVLKWRANLWTYGAYFTAVNQLYHISNTETNLARLQDALDELDWYRSLNRTDDHLVYASKGGEEIPPFYDDNVWIVIGLIKAYETTKDETLLEKAEAVMDYIYGGWQDDEVGGILWREFDYNEETAKQYELSFERNTCINGPAAWASLLLYEITGESKYLSFGTKLYTWTKDKLYDKTTKTYSDNISQLGRVQTHKWTYNTGTMLSAASILYKLTKSDFYKNDVNDLMEGSKNFIEPYSAVPNGEFYNMSNDSPWFRVYLVQGMLDAFRYVDYNYGERLEAVKVAMLYGYENVDSKGFLKADWSNRKANEYGDKQKTLDVSGNIETISILAEYEAILQEVAK